MKDLKKELKSAIEVLKLQRESLREEFEASPLSEGAEFRHYKACTPSLLSYRINHMENNLSELERAIKALDEAVKSAKWSLKKEKR